MEMSRVHRIGMRGGMFPEMTFYVFPELIKADEGFLVNGGKKIVANRWEGANGETGILVWNADDKPAKVSVAFGGRFVSASEPERGEVDVDDPIPPNSLRMYRYKVSDAKGLHQ